MPITRRAMTPPTTRHGRPVETGAELRKYARRPASDVPDLKARLVAGSDVRLVNVSRRGVLVETDARLMPNSAVTVRFVTDAGSVVLKGCVVRSSIALMSKASLVYRTAVSFDQDISLVDPCLWEEPVGDAPPDEAVPEVPQQASGEDASDQALAPAELLVNAEVDGEWLDLSHLLN